MTDKSPEISMTVGSQNVNFGIAQHPAGGAAPMPWSALVDGLGTSTHAARTATTDVLKLSQHSVHDDLGCSQHTAKSDLGASEHSMNHTVITNRESPPLHHLNADVEVDADRNPPPPTNDVNNPSTTLNQALQAYLEQYNYSPSSYSDVDNNNMISKFLSAVVSRVPEITPAIADLLPEEDGDLVSPVREFSSVANAAMLELQMVQERLAKSNDGDDDDTDFYIRVTNCIEALKPYTLDMNTAKGEGGGQTSDILSEPSTDESCQPLVPNDQMKSDDLNTSSKMKKTRFKESPGSLKRCSTPVSDNDDSPSVKNEKKRKSLPSSTSSHSKSPTKSTPIVQGTLLEEKALDADEMKDGIRIRAVSVSDKTGRKQSPMTSQ